MTLGDDYSIERSRSLVGGDLINSREIPWLRHSDHRRYYRLGMFRQSKSYRQLVAMQSGAEPRGVLFSTMDRADRHFDSIPMRADLFLPLSFELSFFRAGWLVYDCRRENRSTFISPLPLIAIFLALLAPWLNESHLINLSQLK